MSVTHQMHIHTISRLLMGNDKILILQNRNVVFFVGFSTTLFIFSFFFDKNTVVHINTHTHTHIKLQELAELLLSAFFFWPFMTLFGLCLEGSTAPARSRYAANPG